MGTQEPKRFKKAAPSADHHHHHHHHHHHRRNRPFSVISAIFEVFLTSPDRYSSRELQIRQKVVPKRFVFDRFVSDFLFGKGVKIFKIPKMGSKLRRVTDGSRPPPTNGSFRGPRGRTTGGGKPMIPHAWRPQRGRRIWACLF